jgi:hypothetical protein
MQPAKVKGPQGDCASRTSTTSGANRTNKLACFTGRGVVWGTRLSPAALLFPNAAVGKVMLITRIQFGGARVSFGLGSKDTGRAISLVQRSAVVPLSDDRREASVGWPFLRLGRACPGKMFVMCFGSGLPLPWSPLLPFICSIFD